MSLTHLMTHRPYNPYCDACVLDNMCGEQHRTVGEMDDPPYGFGEVTFDHKDLSHQPSVNGHLRLFHSLDIGTLFRMVYPSHSKTAEETGKSFDTFKGNCKVKRVRSDIATIICEDPEGQAHTPRQGKDRETAIQ